MYSSSGVALSLADMPSEIDTLTDADLERMFSPDILSQAAITAKLRPAEDLFIGPGQIEGYVDDILVGIDWEPDPWGLSLSFYCDCGARSPCVHVAVLIHSARGLGQPMRQRWRQVLEPISRLADTVPARQAPLGLRFAVVERRHNWGGRVPFSDVTVVPVRIGQSGKWIKSGATWRDLMRATFDDGLVPEQRAALVALAGSVRDSWRLNGPAVGASEFGPSLLPLLVAAWHAGVQFLGARDRPDLVSLESQPARFELHLSDDDVGDTRIQPTLTPSAGDGSASVADTGAETVTDQVRYPLPAGDAGLIGHEGAFWVDEKNVLHLARLADPLAPSIAELACVEPVVVPAADLAEFRAGTGAQLARVTTVSAARPALAVSRTEPPRLVVQVAFDPTPAASLTWGFAYGSERVVPLEASGPVGRDLRGEREILAGLDLIALPALRDTVSDRLGRPVDVSVSGADVITLFDKVLPGLVERGVEMRLAEDAPQIREATEDPVITVRVDEVPESIDWYDLGVTVTIEDQEIAFADLFTALAEGVDRLLLPSGLWLRLDRPEFEQLRALIAEARGLADVAGSGAGLRVNRYQSDWWQELAGLGVIERESATWAAAMAAMQEAVAPRSRLVPAGIHADLRPYQVDGFSWLGFLHDNAIGGILADDMGLGKTLQMLALFAEVRERSPEAQFLVVAPTSVVGNWRREAEQFAPGLDVATIAQTQGRRGCSVVEAVGDAAIVVTSYTLLRLEYEQYQELGWEILVLDEAQFVKNRHAKTYHCVRALEARSKFAITGTPLENSLMDLWSMLSIVAPGLYPDPEKFAEVYRRPIESGAAPELLALLRRRMAPLLRRRTKEQVLAELPPKTEQELVVDLNPRHRALYQKTFNRERQKVLGLIGDMHKNRFEIFRSLTMLRQLAIDPALISDKYEDIGSAKLDQLITQLQEVAAEGHRALVFSQFTRFLARVKDRLAEAGIAFASLDGSTRNRDMVITSFKEGDAPVFLISLKSGGFGLNLTEADYCFVVDPWWNPAAEVQAVDRAHRIGQERPVMVYRYVSSGTIEEKVMALKAHKQAIFDTVIGDDEGALSGALTAADVRGIFE